MDSIALALLPPSLRDLYACYEAAKERTLRCQAAHTYAERALRHARQLHKIGGCAPRVVRYYEAAVADAFAAWSLAESVAYATWSAWERAFSAYSRRSAAGYGRSAEIAPLRA